MQEQSIVNYDTQNYQRDISLILKLVKKIVNYILIERDNRIIRIEKM